MRTLRYHKLLKQHLDILTSLQYDTGLFVASKKSAKTGYDKAWLRDNFYECLAFEVIGDFATVKRTYKSILKIFLKHEAKIDQAIAHKPDADFKYIHARYNPKTFEEFWEGWGNMQNDSIGAILFKIGELEGVKDMRVIETPAEKRVVQKLVYYLRSIEYWHDSDNGMWENDEMVHASSIGACVAGLKMIKRYTALDVPQDLVDKGLETLKTLLPRESKERFVDLSLLSLIWPYGVVTKKQREDILKNVEYHLVRRRGLIRFRNDWYYNRNPDKQSEEAEWTFGFSWLAIIYKMLGDMKNAKSYEKMALDTVTEKGVPELYYSNTDEFNENTPLGWSESLFIVAIYLLHQKHRSRKYERVLRFRR
ncbi:MAG: glycoside hydrolase family 15 [Nanoarchaeota archaeon]|nr:glycoside hydrolase family 15 [Nanoarchaeota archaeon]